MIDTLLEEFERLWQDGSKPDLFRFVSAAQIAHDERSGAIAELIAIDLEYRWKDTAAEKTELKDVATPPTSESNRSIAAETHPMQSAETDAAGDESVGKTLRSNQPESHTAALTVDDYFRLWPDLFGRPAEWTDLIADEFRVRHRWGDQPGMEEFFDRYGRSELLESALQRQLDELRADLCLPTAAAPAAAATGETPESEDVTIAPTAETSRAFGRYQLGQRLGRGGMGEVFKAYDTQLQRYVALKMPHMDRMQETSRKRFINEARAASVLRHPSICPVFDAGEIDGQPFITTAYIDGRNLQEHWQQGHIGEIDEWLPVLISVADALQAAHDLSIVHRDLKPANIMIDSTGTPVVMDFGLAYRPTDTDSRLTRTGEAFGTPLYMAPEQVEGRVGEIGPTSDIYSLGVILFQAITGKPPFDGTPIIVMAAAARDQPPNPSTLCADVDHELEELCLSMLAKSPAERPASMADVASRLGEIHRRLQESTNAPTSKRTEPRTKSVAENGQGSGLRGRWGLIACAVAVPFLVWLGIILLKVQTPYGEVTIAVDEAAADDIVVEVLQEGETIEIASAATGWSLQLAEGRYQVRLGKGKDRFTVAPSQVTVTRDQTQLLTVRLGSGLSDAGSPARQTQPTMAAGVADNKAPSVSPNPSSLLPPLPGLVAAPQLRDDARRWQVETRWPRTQSVFHSYSPDGTLYAIGSRDGYVRILAGGPDGILKCLVPADDRIRQRQAVTVRMDWAPDGRRFVTASVTGRVCIWTVDGRLEAEWPAELLDVDWSPAGDLIAGTNGTAVQLWEPDGTPAAMLRTHEHHPTKHFVSWSPDGKRFATSCRRSILIGNPEGQVLREIHPESAVTHLAWSPTDPGRIATTHWNRQLRVWDADGENLGSSDYEAANWGDRDCFACGWSPDGSAFAIVDSERCQLFDAAAQPTWTAASTQHLGWGDNLTWSPDSRHVQIVKIDRTVVTHRASDGKQLTSSSVSPQRLSGLAWNADHRVLCAATWSGKSLRLFDESGVPTGRFPEFEPRAYDCAWASNGLLSASGSRLVLYHLARDGTQLSREQVLRPNGGDQYRVVDAHRAQDIIAAGRFWDNQIEIIDREGSRLATLDAGRVDVMKFSPDGDSLATADASQIRLWDCASWQETGRIKLSYARIAWSSDGSRLAATNGATGQVIIHEKSGKPLQTIDPVWSQGVVRAGLALAWSPDDGAVVWTRDNDTCCYDFATEIRRNLSRHACNISHAEWLDNDRFITAGEDGTVAAWHGRTGDPLWTILMVIDRHGMASSVTFTGEGKIRHADDEALQQLVTLIENEAGGFQTLDTVSARAAGFLTAAEHRTE